MLAQSRPQSRNVHLYLLLPPPYVKKPRQRGAPLAAFVALCGSCQCLKGRRVHADSNKGAVIHTTSRQGLGSSKLRASRLAALCLYQSTSTRCKRCCLLCCPRCRWQRACAWPAYRGSSTEHGCFGAATSRWEDSDVHHSHVAYNARNQSREECARQCGDHAVFRCWKGNGQLTRHALLTPVLLPLPGRARARRHASAPQRAPR